MVEQTPEMKTTEEEVVIPANNPEWLPRWEIFALGIGDFITIFLFAVIGRASHSMGGGERPFMETLDTTLPFVMAWLVVGAVGGAFSGKAMFPIKRVLIRTLLPALIAAPLGVVLRALLLDRWPAPIFYAISTGTIMLMMLVWRVIWSRFRRLWWPELP